PGLRVAQMMEFCAPEAGGESSAGSACPAGGPSARRSNSASTFSTSDGTVIELIAQYIALSSGNSPSPLESSPPREREELTHSTPCSSRPYTSLTRPSVASAQKRSPRVHSRVSEGPVSGLRPSQ